MFYDKPTNCSWYMLVHVGTCRYMLVPFHPNFWIDPLKRWLSGGFNLSHLGSGRGILTYQYAKIHKQIHRSTSMLLQQKHKSRLDFPSETQDFVQQKTEAPIVNSPRVVSLQPGHGGITYNQRVPTCSMQLLGEKSGSGKKWVYLTHGKPPTMLFGSEHPTCWSVMLYMYSLYTYL